MRQHVLVVAEKDSVAKAIARYLSHSAVRLRNVFGVKTYWFSRDGVRWVSIGLKGHVLDFDFEERYQSWHLVDPRELFRVEPVLIVREDSVKYVRALKHVARGAKEVILALDSDAEGEAIAYEAMLIVKSVNQNVTFRRALFSAITKRDLEQAFRNLVAPRHLLARKVFTRMKLDLTLGAVFTRLLTLAVRSSVRYDGILSYGPCQTPVLGLVVRRAIERESFVPKRYYVLEANVDAHGRELRLISRQRWESLRDAMSVLERLSRERCAVVSRCRYSVVKVMPPKPLDTIELERRASEYLNIRSKRVLDVAEELYRRGYISYPRTETNIYPSTLNLREILQSLLSTEHREYVSKLLAAGKLTPTRGSSYDGAHPPIYPVSGASKQEILREFSGKTVYWTVYDFIVRHFLATLSQPAVIERQEVELMISDVEFHASGLRVIDPGFWTIYPYSKRDERALPRVSVGSELKVLSVKVLEKETEPPQYLSESDLLKLMRAYGIGTDATMQDHIHTNVVRGYFKIVNKRCIPTQLGRALIKVLERHAPTLVDPRFRSMMERELERVVREGADHEQILRKLKEEGERCYAALEREMDGLKAELVSALVSSRGNVKMKRER